MFHYWPVSNKYSSNYHYLKSIKERRKKFWDSIEKINQINKKQINNFKYYTSSTSINNGVSFRTRSSDYYRLNDKSYSKEEITKDDKFIEKTNIDGVTKITNNFDTSSNDNKNSVENTIIEETSNTTDTDTKSAENTATDETRNTTNIEKNHNSIRGISNDYLTNWEKSYINFYNSQYYPYKLRYDLSEGEHMVQEDYDILELQDYGFGWKESKDALRKNNGDLKKTLKQLILENKEKKNKLYENNLKELMNYGYKEGESKHALDTIGNDLKLCLKYLISKEKYI